MPLPGPPAEKEPPPPRRVCRVARAKMSSEEMGRPSKARWMCVKAGIIGLGEGGCVGRERKPPVYFAGRLRSSLEMGM